MKAIFAVVCVAALAATYMYNMDQATPAIESQFEEFVATYRKSYLSEESYSFRLSVFKTNVEEIAAMNAENPDAVYAVNDFADMTEEERISAMGLKPFTGLGAGKTYEAQGVRHSDDLDWVAAEETTKVKDQKSCGSCWAFSGVEALESAYAIANNLKGDEVPTFSEQLFVDCAVEPEFGSAGCQGGWMDDVFSYAQKYSIATEAEYPYKAKNGKCQKELATHTAGVIGTHNVKEGDLEGLLELAVVHPVSIAVDAGSWSFYRSGIHSSKGTALNHGVVLEGYHVAGAKPYLVVRNSWGSRWGEKGYIKLDTVKNSGATLAASAPIMEGVTYPGVQHSKCDDGSDSDSDNNCHCSYGVSCDKTQTTNSGCKSACLCGEFGFCR